MLSAQISDSDFAGKLLSAAESLYTFAKTYTGKYTDCVHDAGDFYRYRLAFIPISNIVLLHD